jgi:hypothetical protein
MNVSGLYAASEIAAELGCAFFHARPADLSRVWNSESIAELNHQLMTRTIQSFKYVFDKKYVTNVDGEYCYICNRDYLEELARVFNELGNSLILLVSDLVPDKTAPQPKTPQPKTPQQKTHVRKVRLKPK